MGQDNTKNFIPPWAQVALICIIILAIVKVCQRKSDSPIDTEKIQAKHVQDSIRFKITMDSLLAISRKNKEIIRKNDSIIAANYKRFSDLLKENERLSEKYKKEWRESNDFPIVDAETVAVPHEFVKDCQGCFDNLEKTTAEAENYRNATIAMQGLYIEQSRIDSQRIAELDADRLRLNKDYNDMRMAAEVNARYMEPRRKIKTGVGTLLNDKFLPNAVGPAIMYQDKKDRSFAGQALFGAGRPVYILNAFVPFSLRNK